MEGFFGRNGNPALRLCGIMQKYHTALADFSFFYGRTFWEEWQPCITVMWHYAKTPQSTSGFLEKKCWVIFWKVCDCPMLGGLFGRNGNPALRLCGIMQKHHGVLADF